MKKIMDKKNIIYYLSFIVFILGVYGFTWLKYKNEALSQSIDISHLRLLSILMVAGTLLITVGFIFLKKYEKYFKWLLVLLIIIGCGLSIYIYRDWYYVYKIFNPANILFYQWPQTASLILLYIIGVIFLWCACKTISPFKLCLYGFVIGCSLWVVLSGILSFTGLPYTLLSMILFIAIVIGFLYWLRKPKLPKRADIKYIVLYSIIFINICILAAYYPGGAFSFDSFKYLDYGLALGHNGSFLSADLTGETVSAYAFFLPSLNAISVIFGYINSHTPIIILFINFLIIFSYELFNLIRNNGIHKLIWLPVLLALIMLISNGSFLTVGLWHLNNNPALIVLFLLAFTLTYCIKEKDIGYAIISTLLISTLLFSRIEMPLYCVLLLVGMSTTAISKQQMFIIYTVPFAILLIYYIGFFLQFGTNVETPFLTLGRSIPVVSTYLLLGIYLLFIWRKHLVKLQKYILSMMYWGMVLGFIILSLFFLSKSIRNLEVISWHTFFEIYSGFNWHLLIGFIPIIALLKYRKSIVNIPSPISIITVTFSLFILVIFLFRDLPLRNGIGDSGNRLIMQLYPFLIFVAFAKLAPLFTGIKPKVLSENTK